MLITSRRIFEKITKPRDQLVPFCVILRICKCTNLYKVGLLENIYTGNNLFLICSSTWLVLCKLSRLRHCYPNGFPAPILPFPSPVLWWRDVRPWFCTLCPNSSLIWYSLNMMEERIKHMCIDVTYFTIYLLFTWKFSITCVVGIFSSDLPFLENSSLRAVLTECNWLLLSYIKTVSLSNFWKCGEE